MMETVLYTFLVTFIVLLIGIVGMAFKSLFIKGKGFPNGHVGSNKAMKDRGINCATSQDREARQKS